MRLLLAAVLVSLLAPRVADACSCSQPAVEVLPAGDGAPTNARVRVFLPPGDWAADVKAITVKLMEKRAVQAAAAPAPARGKKGKKKKAPPPPPPPRAVEVDRVDVGSGDLHVVELAPKTTLAPRTTYVVTLAVAGGKDEIVGEFKTGDAADTTPPTWNGVQKATWLPNAYRGGMCTGSRFAKLELDAEMEPGAVFGVWLATGDGKVDYEQPPLTFVEAWGTSVQLGHHSLCAPTNVTIPDEKQIVVGLRLYDAAGNAAETAGEAVLKLAK